MDKMDIELQILQLTKLQQICNDIIDMENPKQSDTELEKLLKKEYDLSKDETDSILSMVLGKKKGEGVSQKDLDRLKEECEMYCKLTDTNTVDKNSGEFIGYTKIKQKSSNLKNRLNKKLKEIEK